MLLYDDVAKKYGEAFSSYNTVLDTNRPLSMANGMNLPATLISTINRWAFSHD